MEPAIGMGQIIALAVPILTFAECPAAFLTDYYDTASGHTLQPAFIPTCQLTQHLYKAAQGHFTSKYRIQELTEHHSSPILKQWIFTFS